MASPPPPAGADLVAVTQSSTESQLSSLVYELSQNVQLAMDNMLKMISDIDQNSAVIKEDIEKSKDSVLQRKIDLEKERDQFQKTAFAVLDMLNSRDIN